MFAIIKTGGKQLKVAKDEIVRVEKLEGEPGAKIAFAEVLMLGEGASVTVGAPLVAGARVEGEILAQERADKILVVKKRRRKGYRRRRGHRQLQTAVRITDIHAS